MSGQTKSDRVKIWLKEYLSEFGEYSGTIEELSNLTNSSTYVVKRAISSLEEEGFLKSEKKRGKGLTIKLVEGGKMESEEVQTPPVEEENKKEVEEETKKEKKKKTLQDQVLSSLIGKEVTIFLISGTRLEGELLDFDNFTLSITAPKGKSLVYKHAIATILYDVEEK